MFQIYRFFFSFSKYPVLVQKCEVLKNQFLVLGLQTCLFVELQEVWFRRKPWYLVNCKTKQPVPKIKLFFASVSNLLSQPK